MNRIATRLLQGRAQAGGRSTTCYSQGRMTVQPAAFRTRPFAALHGRRSMSIDQTVDILARGFLDVFERIGLGGKPVLRAQFHERFDPVRIVRPALRKAD